MDGAAIPTTVRVEQVHDLGGEHGDQREPAPPVRGRLGVWSIGHDGPPVVEQCSLTNSVLQTNSVRVKYASSMTLPARPRAAVVDPAQGGGPRRALSREAIVAAALEVLRAEGIDACRMRRVGDRARHRARVALRPRRQQGRAARPAVRRGRRRDPDAGAGPGAMAGAGHPAVESTPRETLARNGDIARFALGRVPMGPNALRVAEVTMTLLRAGGVPDQAVAWAVDVVGMYVTANAVEDAVTADLARAGREPQEYYDQVHDYFSGAAGRPLPGHRRAGAADDDGRRRRALPLRPRTPRRRPRRARYRSSSTRSSMSIASCQRPSAERS